jgi:hypothetical protein
VTRNENKNSFKISKEAEDRKKKHEKVRIHQAIPKGEVGVDIQTA